jgi:hypothetical protein
MDFAQQAKMEAEKMYQSNLAQGSARTPTSGLLGYEATQPVRPNLRERVASDLGRARRDANKRDRLEELQLLLDKHPDIARILDLLEDVRG